MTAGYLDALAARSAAVGSVLCVGIDPTPDALPDGFPAGLAGVERFARLIVEAAAPFAAAMKPNVAFFEAFGSAGLAALERVRAVIPAGILVIADAKRGDVETTVMRQAVALFDGLGVDAVTASPYLGLGALAPFLDRVGRFTYVLCRTSNRAAGELQDLVVAADPDRGAPSEPLHRRVARLVAAAGLAIVRASSSVPPHRPSWRESGSWCPAWHSSCRAWARRVARRPTSSPPVMHGPSRPAAVRAVGSS